MTEEHSVSAIIVAAGSSRRMGFDKLSADLCGKSVLARSIESFQDCTAVSEIIVVTSPGLEKKLDRSEYSKVSRVVGGGHDRHLSVWNGILATSDSEASLIAVHDGARPLVSAKSISGCAKVAAEFGAAALAHRVVDTLKRSSHGGCIAMEAVDRENLWAMQTPQIFHRDILLESYEAILAAHSSVTDEVTAVQSAGHGVHFVENSTPNFKITVPADLELAKAWLRANK